MDIISPGTGIYILKKRAHEDSHNTYKIGASLSPMDRMIRAPVSMPILLFLIILIPLLFIMIFVNIISISFTKLGFSPFFAFILLFGSLLGSFINIPLTELESEGDVVTYRPSRYGWFIPEPVIERRSLRTVIAANVGGALIPVFVSLYLLVKFPSMIVPVLIGIVICVLISYKFSIPVPGLGIAMPVFVAPLVSALVAIVLAFIFPNAIRTVIAYVSGVLGVLIGADLLNLNKIKSLGAPTASIGGAGTFDGIFLTGILAVLLV